MDIHNIILLILLNLVPIAELRVSIPVGILVFGLPWPLVFGISLLVHIILAPVLYFLLLKATGFFLQFEKINNFYQRTVEKTQRRAKPYVDKYGVIGLALFIATPLPGSGTYTGTLAAYLLNFGYKRLFIANAVGMFFNGIIWTALSLMGAIAINSLPA